MNCEELINKINSIRKSKSYLTNAFFSKPQLDILLTKAGTQIFESEDLLLLTEEDKDLIRVYFYAIDNEALRKIKDLIPEFNKPIIADIVGKDPEAKKLAEVLIDNGFEQYSIFVRMICNDTEQLSDVDTSIVEYATSDDIDAIYKMLCYTFDPLVAHIPQVEEIVAAIEKKEITVVRKQQQIAAFAFFEIVSPRNVCFRYCIVNKIYRHQGLGDALLARAFVYHGEEVRYMLWVGTHNSAMKKWQSLNFRQDGMIDYILKFKGE